MLSWGHIRRVLQPILLKYWLDRRSNIRTSTRMEGFKLTVFPTVFHPRYFGSTSILARFVSTLDLKGKRFLEIGCGSGLVSMCAARAGAAVVAVDINPEAVRCCLANAAANGFEIDTRLGNLFSSLSHERFDVVAWNPPFLPREAATVAESAFFGGRDFDVIRRFSAEVGCHLKPGASVYTILSADIDIAEVEEIFRKQRFCVGQVFSKKWGLRETMVILCAR
jgi:release factor glutamine methyltransferase